MPELSFAYDRSLRRIDEDGRLHIELTPISKANICPYYGREIPRCQELGLVPDRIYKLFRHPTELSHAAQTSNNIQLLELHRGVSATDPGKSVTVGSTGTDAKFQSPYLMNSLVIWDQEAINLIDSEQKKELSCSYRYDPDMRAGSYEGENYDGVMRNIRFNHVALVKEGRAGSDVMVADAMPLELQHGVNRMKVKTISPKAQVARGALAVYIAPLLASDAKIDLKSVLLGGAAKFAGDLPAITERLTAACAGKLADDAKIDPKALQAAYDAAMDEWDDDEDMAGDEEDEDDEEKKAAEAAAEAKKAKDKRAKDKRARDKAARDKKAADADKDEEKADDEEDDDEEKKKADDADKDDDEKDDKPMTKAAMDAAIIQARADTRAEMQAERKALREAEEIVRPVLGALACDSAPEAYKALFKAEKVDIIGVPEAAFPALARQVVRASQASKGAKPAPMAHDAAGAKNFTTRFPAAAAVRTI